MIELTQDQKFWLNVLLSLDEEVKSEIASVLGICIDKSAMANRFHLKHAQYINGINAVKNLISQPKQLLRGRPKKS